MSVERLRIKKSRHSEIYSKNSILNTLIKQKLEGEMQQIKESTRQNIQRGSEESLVKEKPSTQIQPRRMKSFSHLTFNKIKQSLQYDPISNEVAQFLSHRMRQSPIIETQRLKNVIEARQTPEQLSIKMSARDRFQYLKPKDNESLGRIEKEVRDSVRAISNELWIPEQAQVQELLKNQIVELEYMTRLQNNLKQYQSSANMLSKEQPQNHNFSSSTSIQKDRFRQLKVLGFEGKVQQVNYSTKKYHKDDYINLQQFLKESLGSAPVLAGLNNPSEHLSKCYAVYMGAWKELIRLTYIECWEKGLLLEKLLWSFVRLLKRVIEFQHTANYDQFKEQSQMLKDARTMYEDQIQKLEGLISRTKAELNEKKKTQSRLIITTVSFEKVNKELGEDLDRKTSQLHETQQQLSYIQSKYHNLLNELVESDMIHNDQKRFYIVNKYHQPQMLINLISGGGQKLAGVQIYDETKQTSPNKKKRKFKDLPQSSKLAVVSVDKQKLQQHHQFTRYGKKVKKLQNELNRYWQKKADDLEIQTFLEKILNVRVQDACIETNHRQKLYVDTATQVGDDDEEDKFDFQTFLQQKIQQERTYWKQKHNESQNLYISLQQLYEDSYAQIERLTKINGHLKEQVQSLQRNGSELNQNLSSQIAQKYTLQEEIKTILSEHKQKVEKQNLQIQDLEKQIERLNEVQRDLQKKLRTSKENNEILVRRNVDGETKILKLEKEKQNVIKKVKATAPWLEKFMESVDQMEQSSFTVLFKDISLKIEQYLGQYVEKDSSLFSLTK